MAVVASQATNWRQLFRDLFCREVRGYLEVSAPVPVATIEELFRRVAKGPLFLLAHRLDVPERSLRESSKRDAGIGCFCHGARLATVCRPSTVLQASRRRRRREGMNSTHRVEVVPVVLEKHPNADSLSIVHIYGYTVVVRTADWEGKAIGAYVPPDSIVDSARAQFAFLKDHEHVKARKFRGILSFGLLTTAPDGSRIGDDVAEALGVTHYDPPIATQGKAGGEAEQPPSAYVPIYDLEAFKRYAARVFEPGEPVVVTEKIHGANARFMFDGERMRCGSRTEWKKEHAENLWWRAMRNHPGIEQFCRAFTETVLYAEVYGPVQDLRYGLTTPAVAAFDILDHGAWLSHSSAQKLAQQFALPWVPIIAECPFRENAIVALADGPSLVPTAKHMREGVVVRPLLERVATVVHRDPEGKEHVDTMRAVLKIISGAYLERA